MLNNTKIFVISAPSGAGKTTVINNVLKKRKLKKTISYTTRPPRKNEKNNVDYYFISQKNFEEKIKNNDFIEYAKVHNYFYGTSIDVVNKNLNNNINLIKDIDTQGAKILKNKLKSRAILIFIMPPSIEILEQRLRNRKTDNEKIIQIRLENAKNEINNSSFFDYTIVNDNLSKTVDTICKVIDENI